jgi:hypothetical protein
VKGAVFQSLLVVFGVVLAFAANEWREAAAERREARIALEVIKEELSANRAAALASAAYHQERLALIEERARTGAGVELRDFPRGFLNPATLSTAAWTSAAETGSLANIEYDEIVRLSRIYEMQRAYRDETFTATGIIYQRMFDEGVESVPKNATGLVGLISAFLYREQALVKAYDSALTGEGAGASP